MKRLTAIARGRVQGISYRYFTLRQAEQLGLVGTVANLPDGGVEVVAEGEPEALEKFLQKIRAGPLFARVDRVEETWRDAAGEFSDFRIL